MPLCRQSPGETTYYAWPKSARPSRSFDIFDPWLFADKLRKCYGPPSFFSPETEMKEEEEEEEKRTEEGFATIATVQQLAASVSCII